MIRLTQYVECAGCSSKINPSDLYKILDKLPSVNNSKVLINANSYDDAGVYKISDELALIQTVDLFTPVVDDPYTFGEIAAANSLSDVYAMGGKPITALNITGFPVKRLNKNILTDVLKGGSSKLKEAGVVLLGGHSINDPIVKCGYAILGIVKPERIVVNNRAKPGDNLILTKPLGTGIISTAIQKGRASKDAIRTVSRSMCTLNKNASEVMKEVGVNACTDITGFGLAGHAYEMAIGSKVSLELEISKIPIFETVLKYAKDGFLSSSIDHNRHFVGNNISISKNISEEFINVIFDAQTSGGLLIALPSEKTELMIKKLRNRGVDDASIIGKVIDEKEGKIYIRG